MRSRVLSLFLIGVADRRPTWGARVAGWLCLLLPLPSVLWRLLMLAGVDVGFREAPQFRADPRLVLYVLALDGVEILVALACLGLILPWGERCPRWAPRVGGRVIPRIVPTAIGTAGLVTMLVIWTAMASAFIPAWMGRTDNWTPDAGMSTGQRAFLLLCYLPFAVWPAAIAAALIGYWRRRAPRDDESHGAVPRARRA